MERRQIDPRKQKRRTRVRYTLFRSVLAAAILMTAAFACTGCSKKTGPGTAAPSTGENHTTASVDGSEENLQAQQNKDLPVLNWEEMSPTGSMDLLYADQFSADYYEDGIALITIGDADQFLLLPEGVSAPDGLPASITVLHKPVKNIYLVATSAMDDFIRLDALDSIALSGTKETGWYLPEAKTAMEEGKIAYAGKYSAPDYETIVSSSCELAVESTMIYHTPEVKEQLERLGIPVLVERSSYESHPLGRMEWIRLYGLLTGKEEEADQIFQENMNALSDVLAMKPSGKTAAFFYVTNSGSVNVRKNGDYIAKMIDIAGGTYVPENAGTGENALSTMNMDFESFYAAAKDADVLIYNSTIDGELTTIDELCAKNQLFADFKAVKEGNVWCTGKIMFQETMGLGDMIRDMNAVFSGNREYAFTYLHQLK